MSTREPGVNQVIADILRGMRQRWDVQSEPGGAIRGGSKTPDILLSESGALPLIIENEFEPAPGVEAVATGRLGLKLADGGREIRAVVALRTPEKAAYVPQHELETWLRAHPDFEYALHRRQRGDDDSRWPASGWLRGGLADLALLAQQAMRPDEEIDELAEQLQTHISDAELIFTQRYPQGGEEVAAMLADTLRLEDDKGRQARRMAMAMLANALIFQQSLAPGMTGIPTPSSMHMDDSLVQEETVRVWRDILKINYFPIFHVAREILKWIDQPAVAEEVLEKLYSFLTKLFRSDGLARSHHLTGFAFQRLIADRKFLATFYTQPESAALLASLALPLCQPLGGADWGDADTISSLQVADFACGTGTLLSAVYYRLGALHELHEGKADALHRHMIEQALVGCDVLPLAVHLTLSMLASAYPELTFEHCKMLVMPYGQQTETAKEREYALGSLDLLLDQNVLPTIPTGRTAVGGKGEVESQDLHTISNKSYDLVIMNPPYTRPTNHGGQHSNIPNPAFAAFGTDADGQKAMSARLRRDFKDTCAHGNAGMASYFLAIADRKLHDLGTLAVVLPMVMLSGASWEKTRKMLVDRYDEIIVVTIAGESSEDMSFSADTDLGECLLVAKKYGIRRKSGRAKFLTLQQRPETQLEGEVIGNAIHSADATRRVEDGPFGGSTITIGQDEVGQLISFPIASSGPWQLASISDFSLAQTAWQLVQGNLWLPRTRQHQLETTPLRQFASIGPVDRDINGREGTVPRGPFDIHKPPIHPAPTYPTLWAHDAERERCMETEIDSEATVRTSRSREIKDQLNKKAEAIWATATRAHLPTHFRFNSQSLCVSMTRVDSIGGRAWPSVIFPRECRALWEQAFAVWCNSTLGILLFWWQASRQQSGRGVITVSVLPALPTLDLRALSDGQLAAAARIFEDMKHCPMLPVNQIDEDPVRAELDRRLLTEVLGLPAELCAPDGPMALLRRKLAAEPSIHGGKKSKVTLDVPEGCQPQ